MKIDITQYKCVHKRLTGSQFMMLFVNREDEKDIMVLHVDDVAGFFDSTDPNARYSCIRIDEPGGTYGFDLSLRLGRQEVAGFKEAFVFLDAGCVDFALRVSGREIIWRDFAKKDRWLPDPAEPPK